MNRLKDLRRRKGVNQQEIADLLHITQGAVSHWEIGKTNMDYQYAKILADYFDVSVSYLLGESEKPTSDSQSLGENSAEIQFLKCSYCGFPNIRSDDLYCPNCGKPTGENRCTSCSSVLAPSDCYCPRCGAKSTYYSSGLVSPKNYLVEQSASDEGS